MPLLHLESIGSTEMNPTLEILDTMPDPATFYGAYWNKRPFVVRAGIAPTLMDDFISADELAGLSMDDSPMSRMVMTAGHHHDWSCSYGPFEEDAFAHTGDADWSLLVQNVDQFHPQTAALLHHFGFAPRWLMDDIMVSFSAVGGSIGPHIDSYHVFLVQGEGKRRWKVGQAPIENESFIEGLALKILEGGFKGDEVELSCGDILYVPPLFGHEGTTIENALTYSVGFLGPKLSELFTSYGQYLSECEDIDNRYVGAGLNQDSAGFSISEAAVDTIRGGFIAHLSARRFNQWLVEFFTEHAHEDFGNYTKREDPLSTQQLHSELQSGACLIKPAYVKFAITMSSDQKFCLGFDSHSFVLADSMLPLIHLLMKEHALSIDNCAILFDEPAYGEFLSELYNHQALEFENQIG